MECDVLIIGAGGAGLYAAIRAFDEGARTILWDKGLLGRGGSTVMGAGVSAVGPWSKPGDSLEVHFTDTLVGGADLNDQPLVGILVQESQARIAELEAWGLKFDRDTDGDYVLDIAGGHSYPRVMAISDRVGLQMAKVLRRQVMGRGISRLPDMMALRLLVQDGVVVGAIGLDLGEGRLLQVNSPAVVMATGGIGQLYPATSNPIQSTGDGLALALDAGATLLNMEQMQFYPSGLVHPSSLRGFILGIQEYAKLFNAAGERFMARYEPEDLEHTTRDRLARAIFREIKAGRGTEHGGVYLDATEVPEGIFRSFQHEYEVCRDRGYDLRKRPVEIAPAAHYFMGGIAIDRHARTSLPGLFAAGEVSGGVQGGNRLSGNSLAGILVFGARAGEHAARYALQADRPLPGVEAAGEEERRLQVLIERGRGDLTPMQAKGRLRQLMWEHVGLIRDLAGLEAALDSVREMEQHLLPRISVDGSNLLHNQALLSYLEFENMLSVAQMVARSALAREESRGAHYRRDYSAEVPPPLCTQVRREEGELIISRRSPRQLEMGLGE